MHIDIRINIRKNIRVRLENVTENILIICETERKLKNSEIGLRRSVRPHFGLLSQKRVKIRVPKESRHIRVSIRHFVDLFE